MPPVHDTRVHEPVAGDIVICGAHQAAMAEVFSAIDTRASKNHLRMYLGLIIAMAGFFGTALWYGTSSRCDDQDERVRAMEMRTAVIGTKLENMSATQQEFKVEQRKMREDMKAQFEKLRDLIKNGGPR